MQIFLPELGITLKNFKKMRCKIQECGYYLPCRMFIENTLAVEITMGAVKTQAVYFRDKFGIKHHDKVLRKQQSLGLRLKSCSQVKA